MSQKPVVVISFRDMEAQERVRERLEQGCARLAEEFPETTRFEFTLAVDGVGHTAHGHVNGRELEAATHATAREPLQAADRVLDKLERQLRKVHDKRIFQQRREAQRSPSKRRP